MIDLEQAHMMRNADIFHVEGPVFRLARRFSRWCYGGLLLCLITACGGKTAADVPTSPSVPAANLALLLGSTAGDGDQDGSLAQARFNEPGAVALDANGNLYVADTGNHTIRKISRDGQVTTWAGKSGTPGSSDGAGSTARLNQPLGLALDDAGNLYVADVGNHTVRKITAAGVVSTLAGQAGVAGHADGAATVATLTAPTRLAFGPDKRLYVLDQTNGLVRTIGLDGQVATLAIAGANVSPVDGSPITHRFGSLSGLALDGSGNLFLTDTRFGLVYRVAPGGAVSLFAGTPALIDIDTSRAVDGKGSAARFLAPGDMAIDAQGNLVVTDFYALRKITPTGEVSTLGGQPPALIRPAGVAFATDGTLYIANANVHDHHVNGNGASAIFLRATSGAFTQLAPQAVALDAHDINGVSVPLGTIGALTISDVALYMIDGSYGALRTIGQNGLVTTRTLVPDLAHRGVSQIFDPVAMVADASGNIWLADSRNGIYRVSSSGSVALIAGLKADAAVLPPDIPAAFERIAGLALDSRGTLYVSDASQHAVYRIASGAVSLVAGTPGTSGSNDGAVQSARFNAPGALTVDASGNLYVADNGNHTVRKISAGVTVTTLAGRVGVDGDDDGSTASFGQVRDLAVDDSGSLYVTEVGKRLLRKISPAGLVSTVAGSRSSHGIITGTLPGSLDLVQGLAIGRDGTIYLGSGRAILSLRP